jgi:perosamine synthetase
MDLTRPKFDDNEIELVQQCLDSGWVTSGPFVKRFETLFAARHQVRNAIATTSCTTALHLAAIALGIGPGDEVVVPAFTWVTSANCAEYVGAKAVFADIDPETFNLDPGAMENAITHRTKAVVVVHLFGLSAAMDEILRIAGKHGLAVIEDAACAVGSTYNGRPVGGLGDVGCFSFHPRKVITTGEGGMVTALSEDIATGVACLRNHGATGPPPGSTQMPYTMSTFNLLGYNFRMSDIQAAVGVAQMAKLDDLLNERQTLARQYDEMLGGIDELAIPFVPQNCGHTYQSYVVRIAKGGRRRRNEIMEELNRHGIQTRPGTHAVHRLGYYATKYGIRPEEYPMAVLAEDTSMTLPMFPGMTKEELSLVVSILLKQLGA